MGYSPWGRKESDMTKRHSTVESAPSDLLDSKAFLPRPAILIRLCLLNRNPGFLGPLPLLPFCIFIRLSEERLVKCCWDPVNRQQFYGILSNKDINATLVWG